MVLPKSLQDAIESFESLPSIGPRTAQRLAFYLLRLPQADLDRFAKSISELKIKTNICKLCHNVCDGEICKICDDHTRSNTICVVESPLDVLAIEKSNYNGRYHVLHGVMNPMAGVGPDEIFIPQLMARLALLLQGPGDNSDNLEIILATSTGLEGESTAMYISREIFKKFGTKFKVTRIGKGLPIGADVEFADAQTISDAMAGRGEYKN